jgi:CAAX protease family protein
VQLSSSYTGSVCKKCGAVISNENNYCEQCREYSPLPEKVITPFEHPVLLPVIIFYFLDLTACLVVKSYTYFDDYKHRVWIEIIMAVTTIIFGILNRKELFRLYSFRNFKWRRLMLIIPFAIAVSFLVSFLIHRLNIAFFGKDGLYFYGYDTLRHPVIIMLVSMALYPAVFEEMAFRGFLFNHLEKLFSPRAVIIITSVMFAILHLSFIALFWLLPLALLLGYLRFRYHTLWYGMILHCVFNLTACVIELHQLGML